MKLNLSLLSLLFCVVAAAQPSGGSLPDPDVFSYNVNSVYLNNTIPAANTSVTITQTGLNNRLGTSIGESTVSGVHNTVSVKQASTTGASAADVLVTGSNNTVSVQQSYGQYTNLPNPLDPGFHYINTNITGNGNTVLMKQSDSTTIANSNNIQATISGNLNTMTVDQSGSGNKTLSSNISGGSNIIVLSQNDTGNHLLDLSVLGSTNIISVTQKDSGNHTANVTVNNAVGPSVISVIQQGNSNGNLSLSQTCANPSGCSVSVIQGP